MFKCFGSWTGMPGTISYRIIILDPETAPPLDLDGIGLGGDGEIPTKLFSRSLSRMSSKNQNGS